MKELLHGFKQLKAINLNLTNKDLIILQYIGLSNSHNSVVVVDIDRIVEDCIILNLKRDSINRKINNFKNIGILENVSHENIVKILKNKKLHAKGIGSNRCSWCGINTSCIHNHHYLIQRSKGGKDVVKICPNCHYEFHASNLYKFNYKIIK